jgi:hypothetical protein
MYVFISIPNEGTIPLFCDRTPSLAQYDIDYTAIMFPVPWFQYHGSLTKCAPE